MQLKNYQVFYFRRSIFSDEQPFRKNKEQTAARSISTNDQKKKLSILFFGTDNFALESLKILHQELNSDSGCVQNLSVSCAQMKTLVPAVQQFSIDNNLDFHLWPPDLTNSHYDLGVVASFGHLIPKRIIQAFPKGILNVHGSLLPKLRGAAPVIHAIKNGDTVTGVTIMKIKPSKFDVGEIVACKEVDVLPREIRPELTERLAREGAALLREVINDLDEYLKNAREQGEEGLSQAGLLGKEASFVDFHKQSSIQIYNLWRAVGDFMKLRATWESTGATCRFAICLNPSDLQELNLDSKFPAAAPGRTVYVKINKKKKFLCIRCAEGWIGIDQIYYEKKKVMSPTDFYNGFLKNPTRELYFVQDKPD